MYTWAARPRKVSIMTNLNTIADAIRLTLTSFLPEDYVERFWEDLCRAIVERFRGLDFLNGKRGTLKKAPPAPEWVAPLVKGTYPQAEILWGEGRLIKDGRSQKLGKALRKLGASREQMREFETRTLSSWEWQISTEVKDVLTMSHNRPWTSCMRPGGEVEEGPISDVYGGSALLFWFRPGAAQPCGREVVRVTYLMKEVQKDRWERAPHLLRGGTVYGAGPKISDKEMSEIFGISCETARLWGWCMITDGVWDDVGRDTKEIASSDLEENRALLEEIWAS